MDPVDEIRQDVQMRMQSLGAEIIRFSEKKKSIIGSVSLSETDKSQKVAAERERLKQILDTIFGAGDKSIEAGIKRVLKTSGEQGRERAQAAANIWIEELPDLRRFIEYCAEMIEADAGTREVVKGRKCLTETTVVMDQIAARAERALAEE